MSVFKRAFFALLLENHAVRLYGGEAGEFSERAAFTPDATGQAALTAWLQTQQAPAVHVLVNLPEAAELRENIPHLRGSERRAVLARKLNQHFGDNPFVMATRLGAETVGLRQEESLRLTALPRAPLQGWLDALCGTPLAGIYDVPQLVSILARQQTRWPPLCLVLTLHHDAIRQTLLSAGRVLFSRLLSRPTDAGVEWIADETERLRAYLGRQRLIAADADLPVFLLMPADRQEELRRAFARPGLEKCVLQALSSAHAMSGDLLLLQTLARHPPRSQYAPAALRRDYLRPRRQRVALCAGALILLAGALWGGVNLSEANALQTRTADLHLKIEQTQAQYRAEASRHPALPPAFDTEAARRLLAAYDQHVDATPPTQMLTDLHTLSIWLDQHPEIRLDKLRWQAEVRTLSLEGTATPANFVRFSRTLAGRNIEHEIQQAPAANAGDAAFRLFIYCGSAA
ncbi:MAG: hypothetical protein LBQ81_02840 [Zoogloeaceae bacterium]|jgi:hypothetical protein|nr:hypothetical protein [Zoogloeaceae bacterium]